jgi:hypothetical protein
VKGLRVKIFCFQGAELQVASYRLQGGQTL